MLAARGSKLSERGLMLSEMTLMLAERARYCLRGSLRRVQDWLQGVRCKMSAVSCLVSSRPGPGVRFSYCH